MYQNFDEKYVTINYDEGSSATVTQTTLAYWDLDYGKKILTNDEQLNMYMKPLVSNAIKYLMLDNIKKLVDAKAFVRADKVEDALKNIKYNFYTKRNVRYTILFPNQFAQINIVYINQFEEVYEEQKRLLEEEQKEINSDSILEKQKSTEVIEIEETRAEIEEEKSDISPKVYAEPNEFELDVKIETEKFEIEEEYLTEQKISDYENGNYKKVIKKEILPKKESKVIFRDEDKDDFKEDIKKENLSNILESLDLE